MLTFRPIYRDGAWHKIKIRLPLYCHESTSELKCDQDEKDKCRPRMNRGKTCKLVSQPQNYLSVCQVSSSTFILPTSYPVLVTQIYKWSSWIATLMNAHALGSSLDVQKEGCSISFQPLYPTRGQWLQGACYGKTSFFPPSPPFPLSERFWVQTPKQSQKMFLREHVYHSPPRTYRTSMKGHRALQSHKLGWVELSLHR